MYTTLLFLHNLTRWFVLASLLYAVFVAWRGWLGNKPFTAADNKVRSITAAIMHTQFVLGIILYFVSPMVKYFLGNFKEAVHDRDLRFFGMEHSLMMLTAVVLITVGSVLTRKKETDAAKFKTMAIWYTIVLVFILVNIPWPFSPFGAQRPYFRGL